MEGQVSVAELPKIWNERMTSYLGCTPKDDAQGVLQAGIPTPCSSCTQECNHRRQVQWVAHAAVHAPTARDDLSLTESRGSQPQLRSSFDARQLVGACAGQPVVQLQMHGLLLCLLRSCRRPLAS